MSGSQKVRSLPETVVDRIHELRGEGATIDRIACDLDILPALSERYASPRARSWCVWSILQERREVVEIFEPQGDISAYEKNCKKYEDLIGLKPVKSRSRAAVNAVSEEYCIFSDPHIPHVRVDYLKEMCDRHRGSKAYVVGDVHDWKAFSRFTEPADFTGENVVDVLAHTEAFWDACCDAFPQIDVLWGNHDWRPIKRAVAVLGKEYGFITHQFLMWYYQKRHPQVTIVTQDVKDWEGKTIPGINFYTQIGDCVMGHVERHGISPSRGAILAHDFYLGFRDKLGLDPFRVVLQPHTHRQSFYRHPLTGAYCYEIGCMCDQPSYAYTTHKFQRTQPGYFHLIQRDGVTDVNASRLYSFE